MKSYPLHISRFYVSFVFLGLVFMTLIVPVMYLTHLGDLRSTSRPPGFLVLPWLLIAAWNWFVVLTIPYKILLRDNGHAEFVSLVRTTNIAPVDFISIRPMVWGGGFYVLRHRTCRLRLLLQFTGFHEFLSTIAAANPGLEIRGV